jgi:hypothetical protein
MFWGRFNSRGPGALVQIDGVMNSTKYQAILADNPVASARMLELGSRWTFQQENDPKPDFKIHTEMVLWQQNQCAAMAISVTGPQSNRKPVG